MSADNYVAIIKGKNGKFTGYDLSASGEYGGIRDIKKGGFKVFEVDTIEKAIKKAQKRESEYGYHFINL